MLKIISRICLISLFLTCVVHAPVHAEGNNSVRNWLRSFGLGKMLTPGLQFLWNYKQKRPNRRLAQGRDGHLHWIGAKKPVLSLLEFSDYQCHFCHSFHRKLMAFVRKHPAKVRLIVAPYPLDHKCHPRLKRPYHTRACYLAKVVHCAGEQGSYWAMSGLFHHLGGKLVKSSSYVPNWLGALGLSHAKFQTCMKSAQATHAIKDSIALGIKHKVRGTPTLLLNGKSVPWSATKKLASYLSGQLALRAKGQKKPTSAPAKR